MFTSYRCVNSEEVTRGAVRVAVGQPGAALLGAVGGRA